MFDLHYIIWKTIFLVKIDFLSFLHKQELLDKKSPNKNLSGHIIRWQPTDYQFTQRKLTSVVRMRFAVVETTMNVVDIASILNN